MRLKAQPQDQRLGARFCIVVAGVSQVGVDLAMAMPCSGSS